MAEPSGLFTEVFGVESRGLDLRAGLAGTVATIAPLAAGIALDEPVVGLLAALGGLHGGLGVPKLELRRRVVFGAVAVLGGAAAVGLASTVTGTVWPAAAVALLWCSAWVFLRACGPPGAIDAFMVSAVLVVFSGFDLGATSALEDMGWFVLGGVVGITLMVFAAAGAHGEGSMPGATMLDVVRAGGIAVAHAVARDGLLRAHALRLGIAVSAATLVYQLLDLEHGYWIALTVLAILQPTEHASRVRALQRTAGTVVSTAVVLGILLVTSSDVALLACDLVSVFGLFALGRRGYFWLVAFITPTILLTISVVDYQSFDIALERAAYTGLGIVLGLAIAEVFWRLAPPVTAA